MDSDIGVFLTTLFMVLIMEMGDKTQLLVMAMTSRYKSSQVFFGIIIAILFLNILAVILGSVIGGIKIIQDSVRAGASLLFIFFGLLSLRDDKQEENRSGNGGKRVILAIALAFFLAEFGDKTQLSTFSFAALYPDNPIGVFAGATLGLMAADCLGLVAGALVIKYVPKRIIAYISSVLFILFGLLNGWTTMRYHFVLDFKTCIMVMAFTVLLTLLIAINTILSGKPRDD